MNSIFASLFSPQKPAEVSPTRYSPERSPDGEKSVLRSPSKRRGLGHVRNGVRKSVSFELPDETGEAPIRETTPTPKAALTEQEAPEQGDNDEADAKEDAEEEKDDTDDAAEFEIQALVDHRWDGDSIEVRVEWVQGADSWEPERNLHEDANAMLLDYWKNAGGRPVNPEHPDLFHVARILRATPNGKKVYVEWVGYGPKERTWELKANIEDAAPEAVARFIKLQRARARKPTGKRRKHVAKM